MADGWSYFLEFRGERIALENRKLTLGRSRSCDVSLKDPSISRQHVHLTPGGGKILLEDLGSSNGTFVNGQRVQGTRELHHSDTLGVGDAEARIEILQTAGFETMRLPSAGVAGLSSGIEGVPPAQVGEATSMLQAASVRLAQEALKDEEQPPRPAPPAPRPAPHPPGAHMAPPRPQAGLSPAAPAAGAPALTVGRSATPGLDYPAVDPDVDVPGIDLPDSLEMSQVHLPEAPLDVPGIELSDAHSAGITHLPDTHLPDTHLPDTHLPDMHLPDTDLPPLDAPSRPAAAPRPAPAKPVPAPPPARPPQPARPAQQARPVPPVRPAAPAPLPQQARPAPPPARPQQAPFQPPPARQAAPPLVGFDGPVSVGGVTDLRAAGGAGGGPGPLDSELLPSLDGFDTTLGPGAQLPPSMERARVNVEKAREILPETATASIYTPPVQAPPLAGFGPRLLAVLLDWVWMAALGAVGYFVDTLVPASVFVRGQGPIAASLIATVVVLTGWSIWGTTPGKRTLGLYVCTADGQAGIGFARAFARLFGYLLSGLIFGLGFLMILSSARRGLHDLIAGTYVRRYG